MRPVPLTITALAIATLGIALACGSHPIVVATIEADAGSVDGGPIQCEVSDAGDGGAACQDGSFCSKTSCASTDGVCEAIDSDGCAASEPECGCDGISYYDSCLRQKARVSLAGAGQCDGENMTPQLFCSPRRPCPIKNASCATIAPFFLQVPPLPADDCHSPSGTCWLLPEAPPHDSRQVQGLCGQCIDEWSAIRDGGFYSLCLPPDASAN